MFLRNSKIFFDGVFLSIYSHLLKKLELYKLSRKKELVLKILKMACSKLFRFFLKIPLFKLTTSTRKIFDHTEIFFSFYVAKSTSFEVISVLKINTFAAKLIIFLPLLHLLTQKLVILKVNRNNYYLVTEIAKEQKKKTLF